MSHTEKIPRVALSVAAGGQQKIPLPAASLPDKAMLTCSLKSDQEVSFWFTWGDVGDDPNALPYGHADNPSLCLAGKSRSLAVATAGAPTAATLVVSNAGASPATGLINMATRAHS